MNENSMGLHFLVWLIPWLVPFIVPLLCIIYGLINKNKKPDKAKRMFKTAIVSVAVNMIIVLIFFAVVAVASIALKHKVKNDNRSVSANSEVVSENKSEYTAESTNETEQIDISSLAKWTDYTVYVNGNKVTFPVGLNEFIKGTDTKSQYAETAVKPYSYVMVILTDSQGKKFTVDVFNYSDSVKKAGECTVVNIHVFSHSQSEDNASVVFAGGLKVGDSIAGAKLEKLFGKPGDIWFSTDNTLYKYTYYEDYEVYHDNRRLVITVYNGTVSDISVTNFNNQQS